jgi:small neutral amino acid transporter SnatA (MarC family)
MTETWQLIVLFLATVNPGAVAAAFRPAPEPKDIGTVAATGAGVAAALLLIGILAAEPLLDGLEIEQETFRIAAGVVMLVAGAQAILFGHPRVIEGSRRWQRGVYPLGIPLLAGPATLIAAVNFAADPDAGELRTMVALVPALLLGLALALWAPAKTRGPLEAVGRLTGALTIALAAALVVSGVRDV